ncbi:ribosomal protein S18 acetylase RimI-like enzyme [Pedobacter cryoconitis]|uniref:Ribosomal protein S18 acetylase RimI-like enzyme n=1 Tax=Pedobacter cryoconitis TaxID=188932 RepID=A0A7W8YS99_9SPHI|nr:GNAT family N-acetyltransferase [Pedobacter cryoconitis]MBB5620802.1 ribosomal protein S18 acetylase RimI-like enzyme [Pedobacter cryoconitis]
MNMEIRNLENIDLEKLVSVINLSFSDYIVPMQLNLEKLKSKIVAEDVKLKLSTGVFDGGEMVGIMLHGLRDSGQGLIVYNAATGVIPAYRGKGLVREMYNYLLPELKRLQVKKMGLEVITGNLSAIKAYEKMGYIVARKLDCYTGKLQIKKHNRVTSLKEIDSFNWPELTTFWDTEPSWQNAIQALENSKEHCRLVGAYKNDLLIGYAIFNPTSRKVNQFAVDAAYRGQGIGNELFSYINEVVEGQEIYVFNVDDTAVSTLRFLKSVGLREQISQFEMSRAV